MKKLFVAGLISMLVFVGSSFKSDAWSEDWVKDGYVVEVYGVITREDYNRGLFGQKHIVDYQVNDQYGHSFGDSFNDRFEAFLQTHVGEYVKVTIENHGMLSHADTSIFKYGNYDVLEWEVVTEEEYEANKLSDSEAKDCESYNVPYDTWVANKDNEKVKEEQESTIEEYENKISELEAKIKELEELIKSLNK